MRDEVRSFAAWGSTMALLTLKQAWPWFASTRSTMASASRPRRTLRRATGPRRTSALWRLLRICHGYGAIPGLRFHLCLARQWSRSWRCHGFRRSIRLPLQHWRKGLASPAASDVWFCKISFSRGALAFADPKKTRRSKARMTPSPERANRRMRAAPGALYPAGLDWLAARERTASVEKDLLHNLATEAYHRWRRLRCRVEAQASLAPEAGKSGLRRLCAA